MPVNAAELKTRFTADTTPTEKTLKGFIEKQSGVLASGFRGIGGAMGLAAAAGLAGAGARWANEVAKMATVAGQVKDSFGDLAEGVGESSDAMLDALKRASQGGISEYDLMLSANKAMMLGVADTTEEMTRLMEIAMRRGQALGITDQQAFNDIVTGLGRGSALILDNLGIMIDLDQAYAEYAATLGKTADSLTDVEKKQAMVNAAMRNVGGMSGSASSSPWEGWDAAAADFSMTLGEIIAQPLGQFMKDAAAGVRDLKNALDSARESSAETKQEMDALADSARLNEVRLQVEQLERDYANLIETMGQAKADEIFNTDYGAGKPIENLRELRLLLSTLDADYKKSAAEWSAGEDARTQGLLRTLAAAEAATAAEKMLLAERRKVAVESALAMDEMVNSMSMGAAQDLFDDIGAGAFDHLAELRAVAISTYDEWISKTHDAAIAQFMAQDAVTALANALGEVGPQYDSATQAAIDNANVIAGIVDDVSRQLFGVIGQDAFDNWNDYELILGDVFSEYIDQGYTAEQATIATKDAADALVESVTQLNGGGLDDVSAAALAAEQQLWGTAAAAQAVMDLVGGSGEARLKSLYMGTIGQGNDAAGALAGYNEASAQLEIFKQQLVEAGMPLTDAEFALEQFVNGYEQQTSAITGAYREQQQELQGSARANKSAGSAARDAADGLNELNSMLSNVPGLFDTSEVTQEDLDAGTGYQDKADEYLRRLRDEVQNGTDWEGVDIKDAAAALGMDPNAAAEEILNAFQAAWANSSLFADPANMKFLNMDAIQASLDQQLASAEGEKNLRALFGIGSDEDVSAVAALGLEVQSGLAGWLSENGMGDAGTRLAEALGTGLKDSGSELGGGVADGLSDWGSSKEGQTAITDFGEWLGDMISASVKIRPTLPTDVPPVDGGGAGGGGASGGSGGTTSNDGRARAEAYGSGVTIINNNNVPTARQARMVSQYTAQEFARRSRA